MASIAPINNYQNRQSLRDAVPLSTPFTLNVFPTNACNFRCRYCAQSLGTKTLKEKYNFTYDTMSLPLFAKAVEQAQDFLDTVNSGAFSFLLGESNDEKTGDAENDG